MLDEEICLEVCGSCTQEEIWKDKDCKICHRNILEALKIVKRFTWCAYCGKEFPLDSVTADQVGEHIKTCEKHPLYQAQKRIKELEIALEADAADLWKITNAIKKEIAAREWIQEGRGCYAWDDNRYKDETRIAFNAVLELIKNVQHPAQQRFHEVIK